MMAQWSLPRKTGGELGGESPRGSRLPWTLRIGDFSLTGIIGSVYGNRIVHFRSATLKAKDWLRAWIHHLARCASQPTWAGALPLLSWGRMGVVRFAPVENSPAVLSGPFAQLLWEGLRQPPCSSRQVRLPTAEAEINPSSRQKDIPHRSCPQEVGRQRAIAFQREGGRLQCVLLQEHRSARWRFSWKPRARGIPARCCAMPHPKNENAGAI